MKKVFHNITACILVFVVLFSTLSFTVDMHYCGKTLVDVALFKEAKTCGMEIQKSKTTTTCAMTKKNCCSDKHLNFEGQDELKISYDKFTLEQYIFVASFYNAYINLFEGLEEHIVPFREYSPPLVVRNIQQLDEVYLI